MTYETECPNCTAEATAVDDRTAIIIECDTCQTATTLPRRHLEAA